MVVTTNGPAFIARRPKGVAFTIGPARASVIANALSAIACTAFFGAIVAWLLRL